MPDAEQQFARGSFSRRTAEQLREKPPSAKLVAFVLHQHDELAIQQIHERSLLPTRTIRYALNLLRKDELVGQRTGLSDARTKVYFWKAPDT